MEACGSAQICLVKVCVDKEDTWIAHENTLQPRKGSHLQKQKPELTQDPELAMVPAQGEDDLGSREPLLEDVVLGAIGCK